MDQQFGFSSKLVIPDQPLFPGGDTVWFTQALTYWGVRGGLEVTGATGLTVGVKGFYAASSDTQIAGGAAYIRIPFNATPFAARY